MRIPKVAVARRRSKTRHLQRARRRRFHVEQLEDRRMLASDFLNAGVLAEGEGPEGRVAIHLSTTDLSGNAISSVSVGQRFLLQANVEDLRDEALGVFAAYFDVHFDSSRADVLGPLVHGASFLNGVAGDIDQPGLIDEVGGFRTTLVPPGEATASLFSVMITADTAGRLAFESGPADVLPDHAVLLYGVDTQIPRDLIDFGRIAIEVSPSGGGSDIDAIDDSYEVLAGSLENRFDVLVNDAGFGDFVVSAVDDAGLAGEVTIARGGQGIVYSPAAGFVGTERFSYTAMDETGATDDAIVTVSVQASDSNDAVVAIRLEATDFAGSPIVSVAAGDEFLLNAFVEDLRDDVQGVFAAYFDLFYSSNMVEPLGEVDFGFDFVNGTSGNLEIPGIVDEVGAFRQSINPAPIGESQLFTIPFLATAGGHAAFRSDPADELPVHAILVYGDNDLVPNRRVSFGGLSLHVVSDVIGVDDSFHVSEDTTVEFDVLGNDVHKSDDELQIREVDAATLRGSVVVAADGRTLTYTPEPGFGGTEQFTYVVEGRRGVDSAQVTVHTEPGSANDDVVAIELATTDLDGNPISSIEAGREFWLTASVDDLRDASLDDLGVFAAYFDLLYDTDDVSVVASDAHRLGFDVTFGADYLNGQHGRATVPGLIDEIGSFQTASRPLGSDPLALFAVRLRANSASGATDTFVVQEDARSVVLNVLENDVPHAGTTDFRADPSDDHPVSDVLLFEPTNAVETAGIRFGVTELQIVGGGALAITAVGRASQGGTVVISADGQHLEYSPAPDFFGIETFTYTIDDGNTIAVEVVVEGVNDSPQATDDHYRVRSNHQLTVEARRGLLANDTDADGDRLAVVDNGEPAHGTLEVSENGSFVYVPDPDFVGSDQFTYGAFDGTVVSPVATVDILVEPPPVRIRLEVVDAAGTRQSQVQAGEPLFLRALVQDRRDESYPDRGVGAAYLDVAFDPTQVTPVPDENKESELAIDFGDRYQNGKTVVTDVAGLLGDVGAFQSGFDPLGSEELALFTVQMQVAGLRAVDDQFTVSGNDQVTSLDVLANEMGLSWDVPFDARPADNGPLSDVVLYDPPVVVAEEDIAYVDTAVSISNGVDLSILSATRSARGGRVVVGDGGANIEYVPPAGFVGMDSFEYTVVDANGATGIGRVNIEVVKSWQNQANRFDVNNDGVVSSGDVLAVINELNRNGARELPPRYLGPHYYDVNGDGFLSAQDALSVINWLNRQQANMFENNLEADGEAPPTGQRELTEDRAAVELLPLGLNAQPLAAQFENDRGLTFSTSPERRDGIEPPARFVAQDASVTDRRSHFRRERMQVRDGSQVASDLIEGLDELADDVASIWALND